MLAIVVILTLFTARAYSNHCRCIVGDSCWPSSSDWSALNNTVNGRLIATVPLASPCHIPTYDEDICMSLKQGWPYPQTHIFSPSSFLSPLAQNQSCDPFTPSDTKCELGNYPVYAVNASKAEDVIGALQFVRSHNVRVIIKSTGHDLLGRSSGSGSLSIWMHSFQDMTITKNYSGANTYDEYHGPAATFGPGLLAYQVFEAAQKEGLRILGGTCPTVGIGGGYTSGGGHSLLSSKYGLSADNVLEWDVITAEGRRVTATPSQNADLYWALSGGGTGVFAVILAVTVKAYPDGVVSAAGLTFNITSSPSADAFWSAVEALHTSMPAWFDQNATIAYVIADGTFTLQPLTLPDQSADRVRTLIEPFLGNLSALNVPYTLNITSFPTFLDLYAEYYGPLPYGLPSSSVVQASRLLPRSIFTSENGGSSNALATTQRRVASLLEGSFWIVGTGLALPRTPSAAPSNAVLPAWRDAALHQMVVGQWDWNATWGVNLEKQDTLLRDVLPALAELSPGSGTYMSEGNPRQEDWKTAFYGENYARLLEVKDKWDPEGVFWVDAGVGSDRWVGDEEGRLCKVSNSSGIS